MRGRKTICETTKIPWCRIVMCELLYFRDRDKIDIYLQDCEAWGCRTFIFLSGAQRSRRPDYTCGKTSINLYINSSAPFASNHCYWPNAQSTMQPSNARCCNYTLHQFLTLLLPKYKDVSCYFVSHCDVVFSPQQQKKITARYGHAGPQESWCHKFLSPYIPQAVQYSWSSQFK